jgi:hypothetical protein
VKDTRRPTQIDLEFIREVIHRQKVRRPTLHFTLRNMMVQERRHRRMQI